MKSFKKARLALAFAALTVSTLASIPVLAVDVGVAWAGKSGMTRSVVKGFEAGMKKMAPEVKVEYRKELASMDELTAAAKEFESSKDGMVILRSTGAKYLGKNPPSIPAFIGGCSDPVALGVLNNMDAPEGNVTGVTYTLPVDTQFETFQAIIPNLSSVLLLTEKGHPSSAIDQANTEKTTQALGLAYTSREVGGVDEAVAAINEFKGKVSAVIIGNQAKVFDYAKAIVDAAGTIPVVSYSAKPVKQGALGGFVADDVKLGEMLAESVVDILVKGKAVKDVPVKVDPKPKFYVNVGTAKRLNLDIPYEILEAATLIE